MKKLVLCCLAAGLAAPFAPLRAAGLPDNPSAVLSAPSALGPNLVTNPGFETGNSNGYTLTQARPNDPALEIDQEYSHTGSYCANFFDTYTNSYDTLSQTIATAPGVTYNVSFWLCNWTNGENGFRVEMGGTRLLTLSNSARFDYTQFSYAYTATGTSTILSFSGNNIDSDYYLDDLAVNQVLAPEPSTWVALAVGAGLLGVTASRRRRAARA